MPSESWDIPSLPSIKHEAMKKRFVILKYVLKLAVSLPGRLKLNTAYPCIRNVALVHLQSFGLTIKTEERVCLDREISTQKLRSEFEVHCLLQVPSGRGG